MSEMQQRLSEKQTSAADPTFDIRDEGGWLDVGNAESIGRAANEPCKSDIQNGQQTPDVGNDATVQSGPGEQDESDIHSGRTVAANQADGHEGPRTDRFCDLQPSSGHAWAQTDGECIQKPSFCPLFIRFGRLLTSIYA